MYDHAFFLHWQSARSDTRQLVMLIVSLVIADGHVMLLRDMCCYIYGLWVHILTYHPQEVHIKFVIELYYRHCTLLNKVNKMICLYAYMCLYTFCIFPFLKKFVHKMPHAIPKPV